MYGVLFEGEGRTIGERPLREGEPPVLEQFEDNFLYPLREHAGPLAGTILPPARSASGYFPCPVPCSA